MSEATYDVAVLGGGPGGYAAALRSAVRGAKTCCVEANEIGGTCLNVGCISTKAMLHASELMYHMRHASQLGLACERVQVDGPAFCARVKKVVSTLTGGVEMLLKARKVDVLRARGRLTAPDTIALQGDQGPATVRAKAIILATGSRPAMPSFVPQAENVLTTDDALCATDLPASILIIGGGVIGCEFATVYAELGIPTTVVEALDRLVAVLDEDASAAVARSLKKRGAEVLTGATITSLTSHARGVSAQLAGGRKLQAAAALVAVGREPNADDIGLEELGVEMRGRLVRVDDRCRTNILGLYAVGDLAESRQYAHLAVRMGLVAADNATGHHTSDPRDVVPVGLYTHPEIAAVGASEAQALEAHPDARVAKFPMTASGLANAHAQIEGMVKLIARTDGTILGGLVIGSHATDVIQEVAVAMRHGLKIEDIARTVHAHPTFVEAVGEAAELWLGLPLHVAR